MPLVDIPGLLVLILITLVVVVIQSGLAVGVMYLMHKYLPHKFPRQLPQIQLRSL